MEEDRERLILRKDSNQEPNEIQKVLIDFFIKSEELLQEVVRTFPKDVLTNNKEIGDEYKWDFGKKK